MGTHRTVLHALTALALAGLLFGGAACDDDEVEVGTGTRLDRTIMGAVADEGDLDTLASSLRDAGLADTLNSGGPFTLFAPTDAAFARLPAGTMAQLSLSANRARLRQILMYHVVSGRVSESDLSRMSSLQTVEGQALPVMGQGGQTMVGRAPLTGRTIQASNGVIHLIDEVLIPQP